MITGATSAEYNHDGTWKAKIEVVGEYVSTSDTEPADDGTVYYTYDSTTDTYTEFTGTDFVSGTDYYVTRFYVDEIMSLTITQAMGDNKLAIGAVNSSYCDFSIYTSDRNFVGKTVQVFFQAQEAKWYEETTDTTFDSSKIYYILSSGEYTQYTGDDFESGVTYYEFVTQSVPWRLVGTFICEKPKVSVNTVHITAYDCLKYVEDVAYGTTWTGTYASAADVYSDVLSQLGLTESTITALPWESYEQSHYNYSYVLVADVMSGYTCLELLKYIAAYGGCNVQADVDGSICLRHIHGWTANDAYQLKTKWMGDYSLEEEYLKYNGIKAYNGSSYYSATSPSKPYIYYSPLVHANTGYASAYLAHRVVKGINTNRIRGYSANLITGSPFIQPSDCLWAEYDDYFYDDNDADTTNDGRFMFISNNVIEFDGTIKNTISLNIDVDAEESGTESLTDTFSSLSDTTSSLSDNVSSLQTDVSSLQTDVSSLQTDLAEIQYGSWVTVSSFNYCSAYLITPKYRLVYDTVELIGRVAVTDIASLVGGSPLFTLDSGYCPSTTHHFDTAVTNVYNASSQSCGDCIARMYINSSGEVHLEKVIVLVGNSNVSSGTRVTGGTCNLTFNYRFYI